MEPERNPKKKTLEQYLDWAAELDIKSIAELLQERDSLLRKCDRLKRERDRLKHGGIVNSKAWHA